MLAEAYGLDPTSPKTYVDTELFSLCRYCRTVAYRRTLWGS